MNGIRLAVVTAAVLGLCAVAAPAASWTRIYGGSGDERDAVVVTNIDGTLYLQASSAEKGSASTNTLFARLAFQGAVSWAKLIGGAGVDAYDVFPQPDGSFFVGGRTTSYGTGNPAAPNGNIAYARFSSSWSPLTRKAWGGAKEETGRFMATAGGGFLFYGASGSFCTAPDAADLALFHVGADGVMAWRKVLTYGNGDAAVDAAELADGYVIAWATAEGEPILIKVAKAGGTLLWRRKFQAAAGLSGIRVLATLDGHVLAGMTYGTGEDREVGLVKVSGASGSALWARRYYDTVGLEFLSFLELPNGQVMANALTDEGEGVARPLFLRLSPTGSLKAARRFSISGEELVAEMRKPGTLMDGQSFAGTDNADLVFARLNRTNFIPEWARQFGGSGYDYGQAQVHGSNAVLLAGESETLGGAATNAANVFVAVTDSAGQAPGVSSQTLIVTTQSVAVVATTQIKSTSIFVLKARSTSAPSSISMSVRSATLPSNSY